MGRKSQDGTASTIIGSISGYWLGQGNNEKPVKKSNNSRGA
jgi:membrane protein YqaA with SNARE-associated domain